MSTRFRNTSAGGMYRPGSGGYGDRYDYDRYGSREEDQNGYGRDREYGYRDDDRYGRYGDSNSRDGDRYGRDYEDRFSRDGYRDDDYRGRSRSIDGDQYGTRSRSSDRDRAFDDDGASSRGSGARADNHSQDGRQLERKFSEQNIGAPPSYEAVSESRSPVHSERDGETSVAAAPRASSPSASNNPNQAAFDFAAPTTAPSAAPTHATAVPTASTSAEIDLLGSLSDSLAIVPTTPTIPAGEADTHANSSAIPTFVANQSASNFGNQGFDDPFGDGPFKAFPSTDAGLARQQISTSMPTFQHTMNQNAEVPQPPSAKSKTVTDFNFGDSFSANAYSGPSVSSVQPPSTNSQFFTQELSTPNQESDILADILPPSGPADDVASHAAFSAPTSQSAPPVAAYGQSAQPGIYGQQAQSSANMYSQPTQPSANPYDQPAQQSAYPYGQPRHPSSNVYGQSAQPSVPYSQPAQLSANPYGQPAQLSANPYGQPAQPNANPYGQPTQPNANPYGQPVQPSANPYAQPTQPSSNNTYGNFNTQTVSMAPQIPGSAAQSCNGSFISQGSVVPVASQSAHQTTNAPGAQNNNDVLGGLFSQPGSTTSMLPQSAPSLSTGALAIVPQPSNKKFEPKSAVWADTLSRGLVNLNISGPKTNPLADIGIDFDAINRKEKRMEKPSPTAVTSTVTMGKAMGSGSGVGRAGASVLRPPANPMMGSGMGMDMGMGMGMSMGMGGGPVGGMGMGGYGGMNQQPTGMGMGMNMGMNPGMGMNMGMGQGAHMQPQTGMPGSYNLMMGSSGYSQQPYGGGYR